MVLQSQDSLYQGILSGYRQETSPNTLYTFLWTLLHFSHLTTIVPHQAYIRSFIYTKNTYIPMNVDIESCPDKDSLNIFNEITNKSGKIWNFFFRTFVCIIRVPRYFVYNTKLINTSFVECIWYVECWQSNSMARDIWSSCEGWFTTHITRVFEWPSKIVIRLLTVK